LRKLLKIPWILEAPMIAKDIASKFRESGTILYLKSIIDRAKSVKKLKAMKKTGSVKPDFNASDTKIIPEISSIAGYCIDIFVLQKEHFPLRNIHESRGMLCHGFKGVLQE
jgi:hypothetical protein